MKNEYIPQLSLIREVIRHTDLEYTFRMEYSGDVKPGQITSSPSWEEPARKIHGWGRIFLSGQMRTIS